MRRTPRIAETTTAVHDICDRAARGHQLHNQLAALAPHLPQLARASELGDAAASSAYARALGSIGHIARSRGREDIGAAAHIRSARIALSTRDHSAASYALCSASHCAQSGRPDRARALLRAARDLPGRRSRTEAIDLLVRSAQLMALAGDTEGALRLHRRLIRPTIKHLPDRDGVRESIEAVAYAGFVLDGPVADLNDALETLAAGTAGAAHSNVIKRDLLVQTALCELRLGETSRAQATYGAAREITLTHSLSRDWFGTLDREFGVG